MPTDLTGTPTSLGIGTYNVDADAPSGLGFNAAMGQIDSLLAARATLASPTFTGTPAAPTPAPGDVSTKIATTSFVATSFAPLASPTFTGVPAAPTAAVDTNTTQIATTAYVIGQGYAKLASPALTGTPTAPTPATADNTTKIATTAFVKAQGYLTSVGTVVNTFNGRSGTVVPASGDYTAAQVTNAADKSTASTQAFNATITTGGNLVNSKGTVVSVTTGGNLGPDFNAGMYASITATTGGGTISILGPSNPPTASQTGFLVISIAATGASGCTVTWAANYQFNGFVAKPTTVSAGSRIQYLFYWNPDTSQWFCCGNA